MVSDAIDESITGTPVPFTRTWSPEGIPATAAIVPAAAAQRCIPKTHGGVATSKSPATTGSRDPSAGLTS